MQDVVVRYEPLAHPLAESMLVGAEPSHVEMKTGLGLRADGAAKTVVEGSRE